ncbi:MAG: hypothetical protein JNL83_11925 [Myxococcales bacterium]|nr:hypothetical protein [Myxococcales bacterium]
MRREPIRWILGVLLVVIALNAFGGGYYGLSGARGVPTEWLEGSPFTSYFVPSLILFVVIGGAFLTAGVAVFANAPWRQFAVAAAVAIVAAWLTVQLAIIGYVSWMQPVTAIAAVLAAVLAARLPARAPGRALATG